MENHPTMAAATNPIASGPIIECRMCSLSTDSVSYPPAASITGAASRKAKRVADGRSRLRSIPPGMVEPERDEPGKTANTWNSPTIRLSFQVMVLSSRERFPNHSATNNNTAAVVRRMAASSSGFPNMFWTILFSSSPATSAGTVAMITYHAMRLSAVENGLLKKALISFQ